MIKKRLITLASVGVLMLSLIGCQSNELTPVTDKLKVGMVTDSGSIDDKSFNQGAWEGLVKYKEDNPNCEIQYLQPNGQTTQDYVEAIDNFALSGVEVIVLPGFVFEEALGVAQERYPEITFIAIDAEPLVKYDNGIPVYGIAKNTVSIFFAEQQASFLTGIASALETKTNKVAFLGGMEVPAVQKLGWGFVAGIAYANANLGTNVNFVDYLYQGTFTDFDAGKSISAGMYDKGADIILTAAGAVGVGAISESKTRVESGEEVFVVGVDVDQYEEGLLSNGQSTILTSAMKYLGEATYNQIDAYVNGQFEGGQRILMDISIDGVGLPQSNPNLSEKTIEEINAVVDLIKQGTIKVPKTKEELVTFLVKLKQNFENLRF